MLQDNVHLIDEEGEVILNQHSYSELIKYLIVEFVGVTYTEASNIVDHSYISKPFDNVLSVSIESHNWPYYYTAMLLYYGNIEELIKRGIPDKPPTDTLDDYYKIEERIMEEHHLKEPFEWIS